MLKSAQWIWKRRFSQVINVYSLRRYYLPKRTKLPFPKEALFQTLKLTQWLLLRVVNIYLPCCFYPLLTRAWLFFKPESSWPGNFFFCFLLGIKRLLFRKPKLKEYFSRMLNSESAPQAINQYNLENFHKLKSTWKPAWGKCSPLEFYIYLVESEIEDILRSQTKH